MSQTTQSATPNAAQNSFFLRNHDMIPYALFALMVFSYAMYYATPATSHTHVICKNLILPFSNLGLLLYLILSRALPDLLVHLKHRRKEISSAIVDFNERDDEIALRYNDIKAKLTNVEQEKTAILERANQLAQEESTEMRTQAERKSSRRIEDVRNQAAQELAQMQSEMQRTLLERSFEDAIVLLQSKINDDDQHRLQSDYLQQLGAQS
jgi:F-type H+-transporting ATPase subunit b